MYTAILLIIVLVLLSFLFFRKKESEITNGTYVKLVYYKYNITQNKHIPEVKQKGNYRYIKTKLFSYELELNEKLNKTSDPITKEILYNSYYRIEKA